MNGRFIATYKSSMEAERISGENYRSILYCCTGQQKTTKNGYTWRYHGDPFNKFSIIDSKLKPVKCYNKFQELIAVYNSIHEAERETGVDHTSIIRCCNGKVAYAGIYVWCYEDSCPVYDYNKMIQKPIYQYDLNGNFIARFNSQIEAAEAVNTKPVYIGNCCRKTMKKHKGYKWYYVNDLEQPDKSKILYSNIKENNINTNCKAESCLVCQKCYHKSNEIYINEELRGKI